MGACAWTAAVADPNQWLQVEMAHPATIVGVVTQGHCGLRDPEGSPQGCVSRFSVAYGEAVDQLVYVADKEGKPEVGPPSAPPPTQRRAFGVTPYTISSGKGPVAHRFG